MNGLASALLIRSDAERAIQRWEEWMALREQARENYLKSGSTLPLPKALADDPPPRPEPYVEEEMTDVSVDITANGFDASESFTLDRSMADDIVPASDPGMDRPVVSDSSSSCLSSCRLRLQPASPVGLGINGPQPPPAGGASPSSQSPHMRRKSVLPLDPAVMRDLQVGCADATLVDRRLTCRTTVASKMPRLPRRPPATITKDTMTQILYPCPASRLPHTPTRRDVLEMWHPKCFMIPLRFLSSSPVNLCWRADVSHDALSGIPFTA